jgi:hypothetical protein
MSVPAPLRFLALVAIGWIGARALVIAPGWWVERGEASQIASRAAPTPAPAPAPAPANAQTTERPTGPTIAHSALQPPGHRQVLIRTFPYKNLALTRSVLGSSVPGAGAASLPAFPTFLEAPVALQGPLATASRPAPAAVAQAPPGPGRWSASSWLLLRSDEGGAGLAPGGTLGGSQAGARLLYRVGEGLALSARAYLPLRRTRGAEAAAGVDWRPAARVPIHLLAERRQDLGGEGRSAFAVSAYGGASAALPHGLRLDAYAQAGVVGTKSRDLFADGAVRVSAPVGPVEVGAGAWGGAQPGAARLDAGPQISWRLPVRGANLRVEADWRFRVAGDAAPGSGPALTLAADF